jgi:ribosomal protein S18 acetylase RimI-like enzyme
MVKIKKASRRDVEKIKSLWCEFIDFHERYDSYYKRSENGSKAFDQFVNKQISDRNALVLIAQIDKETCAYLIARLKYRQPVFAETRYGMIYDIAVSEKYRRKGIGKKLYNASIDWFQKRKVKRIELNVATSNPISMKFWTKIGFRPYYERKFINIDT